MVVSVKPILPANGLTTRLTSTSVKVSNTIYQFSMNDTEDATPADLTNFSICFQNSASEPSSILIDGVSLKK